MPTATTEPTKATKRDRPDRVVLAHKFDPNAGFLSGSCKRGNCNRCYSAKCTHSCHKAGCH